MRSVDFRPGSGAWSASGSLHVRSGLPGPGPVTSLAGVADWLGHFAAVEIGARQVRLATDRTRSFPLFYALTPTAVRITDDPDEATAWAAAIDPAARVELLSAGFVTGPRTLFTNVGQVEAGSTLTIDLATGQTTTDAWGLARHEPPATEIANEAAFDAALESTIRAALERLLAAAAGRHLVLPLSGGLDSRLLVAHLKMLGARDVTCFTYGRPGAAEQGLSRAVAEAAGYDWQLVPYTPAVVRRVWDRPATGQWMRAAWSCSALPHAQDYIALVELLREARIPADAVVLPGHTVVGNMHDEALLAAAPVPAEVVTQRILAHHFNLAPDVPTAPPTASAAVAALLQLLDYDGSPRAVRDAIESFNSRERQGKYINNSARTYEFLGLDWAYPMLEADVYRLWTAGAAELTATRAFYARHVERLYATVTGQAPRLHEERTVAVSGGVRARAERALRATGLLPAASHLVRLWGHTHHPLGFNLLLREPRWEQARRTLRLDPVLGRWARAFLKDAWGPRHHLFDSLS
ncbi:hypothetical protein EII12_01590 [Buchananella hordeovulneris]|uniref:asparagine synthase-related protein n=1 Tax=Buchananella hordeovulneris TaxID=52770 RepID=UPI000F5EF416|nr:asparagine synthase-related protein [Buchananella hordeovulneris]RRD53516.1 hypothetical protein EII12_01590 [Buchananella hordeovulneris]